MFIRDHFAIIGEGEHLTAMALNHREHSDSDGLERTLYNAFEAKKYAERVTSVGESTGLFIMTNDGRKRINDKTLSELGDDFLKFGPKPVPLDYTLRGDMFDEG